MSDKPKTLAAILAEMRNRADTVIDGRVITERNLVPQEAVEDWADRIEAAAEREEDRRRDEVLSLQRTIVKMQDAIARQADAVNAAALRVALNQLRDWALLDINENVIRSDEPNYKKLVDGIVEITNAALFSEPARNCDVGTAEEQYKRFKKFCFDNMGDGMNEPRCFQCPLGQSKGSCRFDWAQMRYKAEGGAE